MVVPGDTVIEAPVETADPPQPPEYHFQDAPVPKEPPFTVSVVEPLQIGFGLAVADEGATEFIQQVYVKVIVAYATQESPFGESCKLLVPP